jgi:nitroreductase
MAARPPAVRLLDDLRRSARFESGPVDVRVIEQAIQASMRTIARSSRGPATVKYVLVTDPAAKERLWENMVQASKQEFSSLGLSEQNLRRAFGPTVESASGILFAFVEARKIELADARDRSLRADTVYAGASIANFVIAARGYGLGVAALDYTPFLAADTDIKRLLHVPDAFVLVNIICVGRAAAEAPPIPVRPVSEVLSYERWSRGGTNVPR